MIGRHQQFPSPDEVAVNARNDLYSRALSQPPGEDLRFPTIQEIRMVVALQIDKDRGVGVARGEIVDAQNQRSGLVRRWETADQWEKGIWTHRAAGGRCHPGSHLPSSFQRQLQERDSGVPGEIAQPPTAEPCDICREGPWAAGVTLVDAGTGYPAGWALSGSGSFLGHKHETRTLKLDHEDRNGGLGRDSVADDRVLWRLLFFSVMDSQKHRNTCG